MSFLNSSMVRPASRMMPPEPFVSSSTTARYSEMADVMLSSAS